MFYKMFSFERAVEKLCWELRNRHLSPTALSE